MQLVGATSKFIRRPFILVFKIGYYSITSILIFYFGIQSISNTEINFWLTRFTFIN